MFEILNYLNFFCNLSPNQQLLLTLGIMLQCIKTQAMHIPTLAPTLGPLLFGPDAHPATLIAFNQMSPLFSSGLISMCESMQSIVGVKAHLLNGELHFISCPAEVIAVLDSKSSTAFGN